VIAHVLTNNPVPLPVQWLLAILFFGGALAMLALRRRGWRIAAAVATVCGFSGTVSSWVVAAVQPGVAPYTLRIAAPSPGAVVASPVLLTVCGVRGDGSEVPATDSSHDLAVFIDGREVPTVDSWQFGEVVAPGAHTIRVELVSSSHQAFSPAATASIHVTAAADGIVTQTASC
jgi:hypothetical protein